MSLAILSENLWFPNVNEALEDGLLAIGGDLSVERLKLAYTSGIFPWYDDEIPLWWCPNPRFILYPTNLKVSKSMKQTLKNEAFSVTYNHNFKEVIYNCKNTKRINQMGTWLNHDMINAYTKMHQLGYAHSVEVWQNKKLVGGLYGIKMGKVFFGESMFSHVSNASKYGFIQFVKHLSSEGIELIDCQVYTQHLESLGAEMIDRNLFLQKLQQLI